MISSLYRIIYYSVLVFILTSPAFTNISEAHTRQDGTYHCHVDSWGREYCH